MNYPTVFFLASFITFCTCDVEVSLKQGAVKGHFKTSYNGRTYLSFEGMPYAKPPVGDLRFTDPVPAEKWDGILEGNHQYVCPQLMTVAMDGMQGFRGTEDCLYAYVYVPGETINKDANLPVIVNIHAGSFTFSSPSNFGLPDFIMDQDVIYVNFNYRLGVLGFLSTEDDVVPGNMGLKDQSMALKWIKNNIKEFGGNPDSITLTGISAGSACVHYHYLSPLSKGLFSRGLSMGGTAIQSWALTKKPLEKAKFVARNVSCETDSTEKMVECLRTKTHEELVNAMSGLFVLFNVMPFAPLGPVIEKGGKNSFIDAHPYKLLKNGKVHDVPWINTNVQDEGVAPVGFFIEFNKINYLVKNWNTLIPPTLDMNDTVEDSLKAEVAQKIKKQYYNDQPINMNNTGPLIKLYGDRLFYIDSELALRTHAKVVKSPVYYYMYRMATQTNVFSKKMKPVTSHGMDGRLIFHWANTPALEKEEVKMMGILTKFVKEYATTGIPTMDGKKFEPVSPESEEIKYLDISGPDSIQMNTIKELGPKTFWDSLPIEENKKIVVD